MSCSRTMAQMWQQVDHLKDVIRKQHDKAEKRNAEIKALETENAKLRELIADVHEALCADKAGMFHKLTLVSMEDDMRELGIEVDE